MRIILMAAVAATAIASPAAARDGSGYVGIEAGVLWPKDSTISVREFSDEVDGGGIVAINYKNMGWDADLVAGYDFGMFRLEGELGYKRAKHDEYNANEGICVTGVCGGIAAVATAQDVEGGIDFDGDGSTRVWSLMANALLDVPIGENAALYVGPGIGWASTRITVRPDEFNSSFRMKDSGLAWQLIAGARFAISPNVDLGIKYRYFRTSRIKDDFPNAFDDEQSDVTLRTRFRSHSLLASLIYNFGAEAAPPPPPPPPEPERG